MAYEDWFSSMFNVDTSGNTDPGTGGDAGNYSGADYDAMFANTFGDTGGSPGFEALYGTSAGGPEGAVAGEGLLAQPAATEGTADSFSAFLSKMGTMLSGGLESIYSGTKSIFTTPEGTTQTAMGPDGKPVTTNVPAGGLNDLGKQLLAGAITSIGSASMLKWQEERKSKEASKVRKFQAGEAQKTRDFAAEQQAEKYRRTAYGQAPQMTAKRGLIQGG